MPSGTIPSNILRTTNVVSKSNIKMTLPSVKMVFLSVKKGIV